MVSRDNNTVLWTMAFEEQADSWINPYGIFQDGLHIRTHLWLACRLQHGSDAVCRQRSRCHIGTRPIFRNAGRYCKWWCIEQSPWCLAWEDTVDIQECLCCSSSFDHFFAILIQFESESSTEFLAAWSSFPRQGWWTLTHLPEVGEGMLEGRRLTRGFRKNPIAASQGFIAGIRIGNRNTTSRDWLRCAIWPQRLLY